MNNTPTNMSGDATSLQVSHLETLPASVLTTEWEPGHSFLLKICSSESVKCKVLPVCGDVYVDTIMAAGWNPELIRGIKVVDTTASADNVYQAGW